MTSPKVRAKPEPGTIRAAARCASCGLKIETRGDVDPEWIHVATGEEFCR